LDLDDLVLEENAVEAAQLVLLASSAERNGDSVLAASYFRKAYKLNSLLEEIDYS
jgi:hypothetical protein